MPGKTTADLNKKSFTLALTASLGEKGQLRANYLENVREDQKLVGCYSHIKLLYVNSSSDVKFKGVC